MGHPLIEEFARARELRPEFFRRCQRVFRDEVNPQLDERDALLVENAELKAQNAALTAQLEDAGVLKRSKAKAHKEATVIP